MKLVFDIGMYVGDDTEYYLKKGYKVVAVEANPLLVEEARKKFKAEIEKGSLIIINKGIGDSHGNFSFWVNEKNAEWSSFSRETASKLNTPVREIQVETITLKELFEAYGVPYFLKIDVEGMDKICLRSIDPFNKPKYLSCEVGDPEILEILEEKGYNKFKMINQASGFGSFSSFREVLYVPSFVIKVLWKIRKIFFRSTIPYGNSGPFAEDTSGLWKSLREIKKDFQTYYKEDGRPINRLSWYDFHATY